MINILLEYYDIDAKWLRNDLMKYINSDSRVVVIAFSFRDSRAHNNDEWNMLYGKEQGKYYSGIVQSLQSYGVSESNITFLNYFRDTKETATQKIKQADIIYYLGGLPDRMIERIKEFELVDVLQNHKGIVMGYSAGAVIQLSEYHLSPDEDYKEFSYYKGIPYLSDFYLEVHYENTDIQNEAIRKVINERHKPVYATYLGKGAIIVEDGVLRTLGDVKKFV